MLFQNVCLRIPRIQLEDKVQGKYFIRKNSIEMMRLRRVLVALFYIKRTSPPGEEMDGRDLGWYYRLDLGR